MKNRDTFVAIADPTRRQILDLLRERGTLVAGDIAAHFTSASRPGISRHLRMLRECGLVTARREGKTQYYTLESARLEDIRSGWLANFAALQTDSLAALRRKVESARAGPRKRK